MARLTNPFYRNVGAGSLASGGYIPTPGRINYGGDNYAIGGVANAIATAIGASLYDPDKDPRVGQSELLRRQVAGEDQKLAAQRQIADVIAGMVDFSPEGVQNGIRTISAATAGGGLNADNIANLMRMMVANSPGTSEDQIARAYTGAGGGPRGVDQAFLPSRQDELRSGNFQQQSSLEGMQQAGAMDRARYQTDASVAAQRYNTDVDAATSRANTASTIAAQRQLAEARPESLDQVIAAMVQSGDLDRARQVMALKASPQARPPMDISPSDVGGLDGLIEGMLPEGTELPPELRNRLTIRAGEIYQQTRDAGRAAQMALEELTQTGTQDRLDLGTGLRDREVRVPREAPGTATAAPAEAPAEAPAAPPPLEQREVGKVYQSPRGPMIWTGTGWRPAGT